MQQTPPCEPTSGQLQLLYIDIDAALTTKNGRQYRMDIIRMGAVCHVFKPTAVDSLILVLSSRGCVGDLTVTWVFYPGVIVILISDLWIERVRAIFITGNIASITIWPP